MSVISNRHQVNKFVAGKSQPLANQRLAKIGYKSSKINPAKFASVCVSVPMIDPKEVITDFTPWFPHLRTLMENAQDGIIKSLYESSNGQLTTVGDDEIGYSAILAFLEAEANGGRMTKEFLVAWFNQELQDNLTVVIAEKLGFEELNEEQEKTVSKHVNAYRELISSLAGGKTLLQETQVKSLQKVLELTANEDDETVKKLNLRLENMLKKEKIEDLLEL